MKRRLQLGFIVNPYAGVGGPAAFKGSDAADIQSAAALGHLALTAPARAGVFLAALLPVADSLEVVTVVGAMGETCCRSSQLGYSTIDYSPRQPSHAQDTQDAAKAMVTKGVDLLVFVGGDGTARDVCRAVGMQQLVLGVPAGVKMHSGVYAVHPQAAAEVVKQLVAGELVGVDEREVRDIDEEAFRQGRVRSRYFGSMQVPAEVRYVQQVKQGGQEVEELVLIDIAADIAEAVDDETLLIFGPGSTTQQIQQNLHWPATLLGIDVFKNGELVKADASAVDLESLVEEHQGPMSLFVTAIGGQGHIIGRGNQQLTAKVLKRIGRDNLHVVATKTKLKQLAGRPLLMDSGDADLDLAWQGLIPVVTGYHDRVLYPLGLEALQRSGDSTANIGPLV